MIYTLYPMGYMKFPATAGVESVQIKNPDKLDEYVGKSMMIFEGGADINPELYGEKITYSQSILRGRDVWEQKCYETARRLNIPVIGICRGHQFIAAMEGGKLWQDIFIEARANHRGQHPIRFTEFAQESGFVDLMQTNPTGSPDVVNSYHHQAVRDIPASARVLAEHPVDHINEALWYPHGITVQWHPEFLGHTDFIWHIVKRFNLGAGDDQRKDSDGRGDRVYESGRGGSGVRPAVAEMYGS